MATKILQISDTHIMRPGELAYGRVDTADYLERAVRTVVDAADCIGPLDAVVVSGDLTDLGDSAAYDEFRRIVAPLDAPLYVVPGNHDDRDAMRAAFDGHGYLPERGPLNWTRRVGEVQIVALDSSVPGRPGGEIAEETGAFLSRAVEAADTAPILVFVHHPPFETGIVDMDRIGLDHAPRLFAPLAAARGAVLVASGHVHRMIRTRVDGIDCVIAPSVAHAVALDHRRGVPTGFTLEPPGMLLHDWVGRFRTSLVFSGDYRVPAG